MKIRKDVETLAKIFEADIYETTSNVSYNGKRK